MVGPQSSSDATTSLTLSRPVEWTLHHVLADQLERQNANGATAEATPAVRTAFETLDTGGERYTTAELEAIRAVVAQAHHARRWETDRPQLERLLYRLSVALETEDEPASDREHGL